MREWQKRYWERCKANPECYEKMKEKKRRWWRRYWERCKSNPECYERMKENARRRWEKCKANPECYEKTKERVRRWYERCKRDPECSEKLRMKARKLRMRRRRPDYREYIDFEAVRLEAFRRVMSLDIVTPLSKSFYRALEIVNNVAAKLNINPEELKSVIRVLEGIDRPLMGRTSRTLAAVALLVGLSRLKINDVCEIVGVDPSNIKYCVRDIAKSVDVFMGAGGGG